MKKLFTCFIISLTLGLSAQTPSFAVYEINSQNGSITSTLTNGYLLQLTTSPDNIEETKFKIKNISAVSHTYNIVRSFSFQTVPLDVSGDSNIKPNSYFCFGQLCFGSNVSTADPSNYTVLGAGQDSQTSGQPASFYLSETSNANYYVVRYKVYNVMDANDTTTFFAVYNSPVGIKALDNKADLVSEIYPNPNTNGSAISFDLNKDDELKFQVYNTLGSLVYSTGKQKYAAGKNKLALDCSTLNNGVYFITISSNTAKTTKRLVINK